MSTVVGYRNIPEAIRSLSTLASPDYADLYTATAIQPREMSLEQWAHAVFQGAPLLVRLVVAFVQRVLLGLRLEPRSSPEHPFGWKITDRGENWGRLEAASWFLTAQIVGKVDEDQVSVAVFVRYDRPIAALIWPPLSVAHRRVVRILVRRAVNAQ